MRLLARSFAWGLGGFCLLLLVTALSQRIPGTPLAKSMNLVTAALEGEGGSLREGAAEAVFQATHWYEAAALPAFVGILEGLVLGFFRKLRPLEAVLASLIFTVFAFLFAGKLPPWDLPSSIGPVLFLFSLIGGAAFASDLRQPRKRPA